MKAAHIKFKFQFDSDNMRKAYREFGTIERYCYIEWPKINIGIIIDLWLCVYKLVSLVFSHVHEMKYTACVCEQLHSWNLTLNCVLYNSVFKQVKILEMQKTKCEKSRCGVSVDSSHFRTGSHNICAPKPFFEALRSSRHQWQFTMALRLKYCLKNEIEFYACVDFVEAQYNEYKCVNR